MECDHEDEDMRVARLPRYLFDAGFARVGILHRNSSPDSPRGLVLPGTFGVDRDTSLRRLGRDTRFPHEIAPVTEPARQRRISV
jgi:folate-dependent tRNA-U54 methylase TrmFO/GidA